MSQPISQQNNFNTKSTYSRENADPSQGVELNDFKNNLQKIEKIAVSNGIIEKKTQSAETRDRSFFSYNYTYYSLTHDHLFPY